MKYSFYLLLLFFLPGACGNDVQQNQPASESHSSNAAPIGDTANKNQSILNNIVLEEKGGLQVSSAFLADERGNLVNSQNTVSTGIPVYLTLLIKQGWREEGGFVYPGATQTITTHNGEPVLQSADLFAAAPRIKKEDAAKLRLKVLLRTTRTNIPFYKIRFRIWDKKGKGEITGAYRLVVEK